MYQSMSDAALIQRYKSDTDQQAAQVLYARYNRFVMQRLRIVVPKEEAEERASDIWRRFFCRGIRRYTPHTPFKHYLSTCAKTETKNYLRTIKGRDIAISLQEFDVEDLGEPYRVVELEVNDADFVIQAGVEIVVDDGGAIRFQREATVEVLGVESNPVEIRTASNAVGWNGILVGGSTLTATNLRVLGGGQDDVTQFWREENAAINISGASEVSLSDVFISDSLGWGIVCSSTSPENFNFSNLSYANNILGDINSGCGS